MLATNRDVVLDRIGLTIRTVHTSLVRLLYTEGPNLDPRGVRHRPQYLTQYRIVFLLEKVVPGIYTLSEGNLPSSDL